MKIKKSFYTKGRNVWNDKVETELVILQNEKFQEQINYVFKKLKAYKITCRHIEFTFDSSSLDPNNLKQFQFIIASEIQKIA